MKILGIPGSLRAHSHNKKLLELLASHVVTPDKMTVFQSMAAIPVFNEDLEASGADAPQAVISLWQQASEADVFIFATPEYNQSISGAMKNVIDWLSRAPDKLTLRGKIVAVTGSTTGAWGTRIAQHMTRSVLLSCGGKVVTNASLYHADANNREPSAKELIAFLNALS